MSKYSLYISYSRTYLGSHPTNIQGYLTRWLYYGCNTVQSHYSNHDGLMKTYGKSQDRRAAQGMERMAMVTLDVYIFKSVLVLTQGNSTTNLAISTPEIIDQDSVSYIIRAHMDYYWQDFVFFLWHASGCHRILPVRQF